MIKQYDYTTLAKYYDELELSGTSTDKLNIALYKILKKHNVKNLLDMTAGTGAQALFLSKYFKVVANDINKAMLDVARRKAKKAKAKIRFNIGDMRTAKLGKFDAVISMFNAIGHLSKEGFKVALRNINKNLKDGGIYIFDIFNLDYMIHNFHGYEFIDRALEHNGMTFVRFNKNTFDVKNGIINIHQRTYVQKGYEKPMLFRENWQLQIYNTSTLKEMLKRNGFATYKIYNGIGKSFNPKKDISIMVVARKP